MSNKAHRDDLEEELKREEEAHGAKKWLIIILVILLVLGIGTSVWYWKAQQAKQVQRQLQK